MIWPEIEPWSPRPVVNTLPTLSYIYIYIYIVIHRQTVLLYYNSSVWLDTQDVSSWNCSQANFSSVGHLTCKLSSFQPKQRIFKVYFQIYLSVTGVNNSWEELYVYTHVAAGNSPLECSTHRRSIYIYIYIYIYCHPQTDLFRSIRTHQCG